MLLKNRPFTRVETHRSAQKIYIFCEGKDREYHYFRYFEGIDTHLNLIVYELHGEENNSPKGLYNLAVSSLIKSKSNPNPKYDDYRENDEVWIIVDTDTDKDNSRKQPLIGIREKISKKKDFENGHIAQSNPCFEVWLYYHQENQKPHFEGIEISAQWKKFVGEVIKGGFNPRKHPILIQNAMLNAEAHFLTDQDGFPNIATTEVFRLAQSILAVGNIKERIEIELKNSKKKQDPSV